LQFPARPGSQWLDQCFSSDSGQNDQISANIARLVPNDILHLIVHDDDILVIIFIAKDG